MGKGARRQTKERRRAKFAKKKAYKESKDYLKDQDLEARRRRAQSPGTIQVIKPKGMKLASSVIRPSREDRWVYDEILHREQPPPQVWPTIRHEEPRPKMERASGKFVPRLGVMSHELSAREKAQLLRDWCPEYAHADLEGLEADLEGDSWEIIHRGSKVNRRVNLLLLERPWEQTEGTVRPREERREPRAGEPMMRREPMGRPAHRPAFEDLPDVRKAQLLKEYHVAYRNMDPQIILRKVKSGEAISGLYYVRGLYNASEID